ncbi:MAG: L-2-hydroxyglutarate oxidase [Ignavibacteriae bacterium HGW-Ignavibacteriae-3]|nr:MAG: L-2-hydroxyglutarate oxidase [Ignavibacteriae bacterium HGW-Ignavibacteriae-3]
MKYDVIIIGAGIVGLASALKLREKNHSLKILILEKEDGVARHQTGNNSGVIHSGIYYKPGSLKARNCVNGYKMLIDFCEKNEVNYKISGKVIIASSQNEIPAMENIFKRGEQNGLRGLKKLTPEEIRELEPHADGAGGIFVPQTGIINYSEVSEKYLELLQNSDVKIEFRKRVEDIIVRNDHCEVVTKHGSYQSKITVTCAGLFADRLSKITHPDLPLRLIPFRGEYYKLKDEKKYLVNTLIYPVPDPSFPFLGVHFTRMINGDVECGPNAVLSFKREGYKKTSFDLRDTFETITWSGFHKIIKKHWRMGLGEFYRSYNKKAFVKALSKLIPEIKEDDLIPGGAGVRAQACLPDGSLLDDFYICEDKRIIHVCNAPSPAATASLSIGDFISENVLKKL